MIQLVTLKQELEKKGKEVIQARKESSQKSTRINELRQQVMMLTQSNSLLTQDKERLAADCKHNEEEVEDLRTKIKSLQDAFTSPSGDPRSSALNRLIVEHPAPQNLSFITAVSNKGEKAPLSSLDNNKPCSVESDFLSPFELKTKQCGIIGLAKSKSMTASSSQFGRRSPCKDQTNFRMLDSSPKCTLPSSQPSTTSNVIKSSLTQGIFKRSKMDDLESPPIVPSHMFYDGLGGHSKLDTFPVRSAKDFKINGNSNISRKPKGVSRPKTSANLKQASVRSIDTFFATLDS